LHGAKPGLGVDFLGDIYTFDDLPALEALSGVYL